MPPHFIHSHLNPPLSGARFGPSRGASDTTTATLLLALIEDVLVRPRQRGRMASPPLPSTGRLINRYGYRTDPEADEDSFHVGLDFYAPRGTPVFAVRAGVVELLTADDAPAEGLLGYGNGVVLFHPDDGLWSFSAHLDEALVVAGMEVEPGQVIGRVGATTNGRLPTMVSRLHLELRVRAADGQPPFPGPFRLNNRDPEQWLQTLGIGVDREGSFSIRRPADRPSAIGGDRGWLLEAELEPEQVAKGFALPTPMPRDR